MKKDNINILFENLKESFDVENPSEGHEQRFLDKLNAKNNTLVSSNRKTKIWKPVMAIAASILILIAVFVPMQQSHGMKDLASISPEMATTQEFFTTTINSELERLKGETTPETQKLVNDAFTQITLLEKQYEQLKKDLNNSGNDKRVIYAMISNFQSRIDLLENVLHHIENVKQLNQKTNENSTTI